MAYIKLDASLPIIQEFLAFVERDDTQTDDIVALGYLLYKHGLMDRFMSYMTSKKDTHVQDIISACKTELASKEQALAKEMEVAREFFEQKILCKDQIIEGLHKQVQDIQSACSNQLQLVQQQWEKGFGQDVIESKLQMHRLQHEATLHEKHIALVSELQHYKLLSEQLQQELQAHRDSGVAYQIGDLERRLAEKEQLIDLMSKTNAAKGMYGENMVSNVLKEAFPKHTITDMSGTDHMADLHMTSDAGETILVECKNKNNITKLDLEKFFFDIDHVSKTQKCVGGIFVSIHTKNIPGKGEFSLEVYRHIPVMFVGFASEADCTKWLPLHMQALVAVAQYHQMQHNDTQTMNDILDKVRPLVEHMYRLKKHIDKLKNTYLQGMNAAVLDMETECANVIASIHAAVGKDRVTSAYNAHTELQCSVCGKTFKNKAGCAAHTRSCRS